MKRKLRAALVAVFIAFIPAFAITAAAPVAAEDAVAITGILGPQLGADLGRVKTQLRAKGYRVTGYQWFAVGAIPKGARVIGHSAGADAALRTGAKRIVTYDPTFLNPGCPSKSKCVNFYSPLDAFPLIICCGGYPVRGAQNIIVKPPHLTMPNTYATAGVKALTAP